MVCCEDRKDWSITVLSPWSCTLSILGHQSERYVASRIETMPATSLTREDVHSVWQECLQEYNYLLGFEELRMAQGSILMQIEVIIFHCFSYLQALQRRSWSYSYHMLNASVSINVKYSHEAHQAATVIEPLSFSCTPYPKTHQTATSWSYR